MPFSGSGRPSRSFIPRTTDSRHNGPFSPNLLLETDFPTLPGRVLVGDITYIPLAGSEWGYLAAWMDLFSPLRRTGKIKGWSVADNMGEELVHSALRKAMGSNQLVMGSIIHSDRGGQYIGKSFRQTLADFKFRQSMSRPDDPYDNRTGGPAFMESCWSRLNGAARAGRTIREWCV